MTKIRKFCACGVKLEKTVASEETARKTVEEFWRAHSGFGHGRVDREEYERVIRGIIRQSAARKPQRAATAPLLEPLAPAGSGHFWVDRFGIIFCSTCLVTSRAFGTHCAGAALVKYPDVNIQFPGQVSR